MTRQPQRLPRQVDPFRLAEAGQTLEGRIPLKHLKRLLPLLSDSEGEVEVVLEFGTDEMAVAHLNGHIKTELRLVCQRCLEPMAWPVDERFSLGLVSADSLAERLAEQYEPYVVEETPIHLADVIEDELLLALPQVPKHPLEDCPARSMVTTPGQQEQAGDEDQETKPFAALKEMLQDD